MESKELAIRLARALDAKKGYNIRILHVENLTTVTDYFVIATGHYTTHMAALADEADFQLGRAGVNVLRT
uniref:RsfS/YbeB/iojap family protein n=1 Tax=Gemmiger qucibialis TaxID=2997294 RepID=UPI003FF00606